MAGINVPIVVNVKDAKANIRDFNKEMKNVEQSYKLTAAQMDINGTQIDKLTAKQKTLSEQLKLQESITTTTQKGYALQVKTVEENQQKVIKAEEKLQKAREDNTKKTEDAEKKVQRLTTALEKAKKEHGDNSTEVEKATKKLDSANKELEKAKNSVQNHEAALERANKQYERSTHALTQWEQNIEKSEAAERLLQASIEETTREINTQSGMFQKASSSINDFADNYKKGAESVSGLTSAMSSAGNALTMGVTAPLLAAATGAAMASQKLNEGLASVATLAVDDSRLLELKKGSQELAISVGKDTDDIVAGVYSIVSALGDSNETLKLAEINARAASAGLATTQEAISLTTAVTKGYNDITAEAMQKASDLAFETLRLGQTTFPDLASSIGSVVPASNALKISQEELFAVFATLTGVKYCPVTQQCVA